MASTTNFKRMILPYYVYVLQSQRDLLLYRGLTTNLEQRIRNHIAGITLSISKSQLSKIA